MAAEHVCGARNSFCGEAEAQGGQGKMWAASSAECLFSNGTAGPVRARVQTENYGEGSLTILLHFLGGVLASLPLLIWYRDPLGFLAWTPAVAQATTPPAAAPQARAGSANESESLSCDKKRLRDNLRSTSLNRKADLPRGHTVSSAGNNDTKEVDDDAADP
jgi:hypothetical protein